MPQRSTLMTTRAMSLATASAAVIAAGLWTAFGDEPGPIAAGRPAAVAGTVSDAETTSAVRPVPLPRPVLGAGSCTSSGCHAAAVEGHAAWQSSYTVWSTRDRHTRAHRVLFEPLAERIVAALAVRDPAQPPVPAHQHTACIGCHATGRGPLAAEGVSCESCHGPAGDWLVPHALPGWRTKGNSLGMVDLADPFAAARQCAGCHVGGPPAADGSLREVSHDLIAAGHPRLAFELRSFKQAEPPHWHDRFAAATPGDDRPADNTAAAAARLDPLDEWSLGRAGALRAFLEQAGTQAAAAQRQAAARSQAAGVWPEFTAFDCYGCHRPALPPQDRAAGALPHGGPLGVPRLEPLHWTLLGLALPAETADTLGRFRADVERRWWQPPDAEAIEECLAAIDAARAHHHPPFAGMTAAAAADRVVAGVDPARWDEAAAGLAALTAIVDRAAARGTAAATLAPARERLAVIRGLLEFPQSVVDGRRERYDSPRDYDAGHVAEAIKAAAAALRAVP
jgi:hypothetical protein